MNSENQATRQNDITKPLNPENGTNVWLPNYESTNDKKMTEKASEIVSNAKEAISDQFRNLTRSSDKNSAPRDLLNDSENFYTTTQSNSDKPLNPENGTNIWLPNYENSNNRGMSEKAGEMFSNAKQAVSDQFRNLTGDSDRNSTSKDLTSNSENFRDTTRLDTDKPLNPENGTNIWLPNYENTSNKGITQKAGEVFSNAKEAVSDGFRNLTNKKDVSNNREDVLGTVQFDTNKPLNPENGTNIWLPNYENTNNKGITERAGEMLSNAKETISNQWKNLTEKSDKSTTTTLQNFSNNAENLQESRSSDIINKPLNPENGTNVWLPNYEQSSR